VRRLQPGYPAALLFEVELLKVIRPSAARRSAAAAS